MQIAHKGKIVSSETREKLSKAIKGVPLSDERKAKRKTGPLSDETKNKLSEALKGKPKSQTHKENMKGLIHSAKWYSIISPDGTRYEVYNISAFCSEYNLNRSSLSKMSGKYKNWICIALDRTDNPQKYICNITYAPTA